MSNITPASVLALLSGKKPALSTGRITLERPFDISPGDFLQFAEEDLQSGLDHSNVNSLSNIKRALDCQLDCMLITLGFLGIAGKKHWGFPQKLKFVQDLGVLTPRILRRINRLRNLLEHEFSLPSPESVEDALDVATLFVAYTNVVFDNSSSSLQYFFLDTLEEGDSIDIELRFVSKEDSDKYVEIFHKTEKRIPETPQPQETPKPKRRDPFKRLHYPPEISSCIVHPSDKEFLPFLKMLLVAKSLKGPPTVR